MHSKKNSAAWCNVHIPTPRINPDKRDEDRESDRFLTKNQFYSKLNNFTIDLYFLNYTIFLELNAFWLNEER